MPKQFLTLRDLGQRGIWDLLDQAKNQEDAASFFAPYFKVGDESGNPAAVMANLLRIREHDPDFTHTRIAWLGSGKGAANSWIEAAIYFPLELFMLILPEDEPDRGLLALALQSGAKIFLTYDHDMAVQGATYLATQNSFEKVG